MLPNNEALMTGLAAAMKAVELLDGRGFAVSLATVFKLIEQVEHDHKRSMTAYGPELPFISRKQGGRA